MTHLVHHLQVRQRIGDYSQRFKTVEENQLEAKREICGSDIQEDAEGIRQGSGLPSYKYLF